MDTVLHEIAKDLMKFEIEGNYWDYPPEIFVVLPPAPDDPERHRLAILVLTAEFWNNADPATLVRILGTALTIPGAPEPNLEVEVGDPIVAVIIRSEGWGLKGLTPEALAQHQEFTATGGRIVDHPDRVETRNFTVIADEGDVYGLNWARGDDEPTESTSIGGNMVEAGLTLLRGLRLHYAMPTD